VKFTVDSAKGSLTDGAQAEVTVDTGKTAALPNVTNVDGTGYQFAGWALKDSENMISGASTDAITKDTELVAKFVDGTYAITFTEDGTNVNFTISSGVTTTTENQVTSKTVKHGTAVTFTVAVADTVKKAITGMTYKVGSGDPVTLTANNDGSYTIPADMITGEITVTPVLTNTYVVTFQVADADKEKGGVRYGSDAATQTVQKIYNQGETIKSEDLPELVANPGYTAGSWDPAIVGTAVNADVTYTAASFTDASYTATAATESGLTIAAASTPTHNTDYVFTVAADAKIVTGVKYTVGTDTTEHDAEKVTTDGVYTGAYKIPGSAITGNLTITATTLTGTITFIQNVGTESEKSYMALAGGTKIAVIDVDQLSSGKYTLQGGSDFYWSSKYGTNGAYVAIVDTAMTETQLAARFLRSDDGSNEAIGYAGDVSGTNGTNAFDAGIIGDLLHQSGNVSYTITDKQRLEADVNGDGTVSVQDIIWIVNQVLGIPGNT
jgi:hypothetical protein